jgi:ubiquinone biosynthesis protein
VTGRRSSRLADTRLELVRAVEFSVAMVRFFGPLLIHRLLRRERDDGTRLGVALRQALESLGMTYLKLGQYLAMRFDLLPVVVCRELGRLFDDVRSMSFDQARTVIETSLGKPIEEAFARFEHEPLAGASIAQVHTAWTHDGMKVAVKVQRPGLERVFGADVRIMKRLTGIVDVFHLLGRLSAVEMVEQFATWTFRELDFSLEGRTAERVGRNAEDYEEEPAVLWELSGEKVLTLEFIEGVTLSEVVRIVEEGGLEQLAVVHPEMDVDVVLHHLTFASLNQIFVTGLFHGDAHPGNVFVLDDNRVAFVDFGIFGELTRFDRDLLGAQIEQLAIGNIDGSLRAYTRQLAITEESDVQAFRRDAREVLQRWYDISLRADSPVADRHLGKYTMEMIDISRRYKLLYDMSFLLYWRALNALDSSALRLSPTFDLMIELRTFFEQVRPSAGEQLRHAALDTTNWGTARELTRAAPRRVRSLVGGADRGRFHGLLVPSESNGSRHARNAEARWLGLCAMSVSLMIVAGAAGGLAAGLVMMSLGLALAGRSLVRLVGVRR